MRNFIERWKDWFGFYRHRTNWHKHPWITRFLCYMGRHDYEGHGVISQNYVLLKCFYCDQQKGSSFHHDS